MKSFAELFKRYRLRSEFETISSFSDALSRKGYFYDESIFSHWQKGTRIPNNRELVITLIELFMERGAITSLDQANELLESVNQGFLTKKEYENFSFITPIKSVFQVPSELEDFTGRKKFLQVILNEVKKNRLVHIYGSPGVGKTSLAIKAAHDLRTNFSDGVLWYRMDTTSITDVFISIAHTLQLDLPKSKSVEIIASFIRSTLSQKKLLLIFDNVELDSNLHLLLPTTAPSSVIILSRQKNIYLPAKVTSLFLDSFENSEVLLLFERIFSKAYIQEHRKALLSLGKFTGNMPLAIHLMASQLKKTRLTPLEMIKQLEKEELSLSKLSYENRNLYLAFNISYKNLLKSSQAVFLSLGALEGKDFTIEAIAYMNGLTVEKAQVLIDEIYNCSLIESSINGKYRVHPMIRKFIGEKVNTPHYALFVKVILLLFGGFTLFWLALQMLSLSWSYNEAFSSTYFIISLLGAVWGYSLALKWGGVKSSIGKVIIIFSSGLLMQAFGQNFYAYYNLIQKVDIPYPSLGDIGYFISTVLYAYGVYLLAKCTNVKYDLNILKSHQYIAGIFFIGMILFSFLLYTNYTFDNISYLTFFLDFWYTAGSSIYLFPIVLLFAEHTKKKNIMKDIVLFFLLALLMQFLSDYVFVYQANAKIWKVGAINDYMYLSSYLLMTIAILKLNGDLSKIIKK